MSAFEMGKETPMLLITVFVLVFVTVMFYILMGNFQVGGEAISIKEKESELVALRTLKCLQPGDEKVVDCMKQDKYGIQIDFGNDIFFNVNDDLFNKLKESEEGYMVLHRFVGMPLIYVVFEDE